MPESPQPRSAGQFEPISIHGVTLSLAPTQEIVSIGPFAGQKEAVNRIIQTSFGVTLPDTFSTVKGTDNIEFTRTAHNQWFATAPDNIRLLKKFIELFDGIAAVTDQGNSRITFRVDGRGVRPILSKLLPIDLDPDSFPAGQTALTVAGHIPVTIRNAGDEEAYEFTVFRSFSQSLFHDIHVAMKGGIPNSERVSR